MILVVDQQIESQNKFQYSHWLKYKRYKDAWNWSLVNAMNIRRMRRPERAPEKKLRVLITSHRTHLLDMGNLIGGSKPLPDFLVKMKFLKDDSPEWCDIEYRQVKCKTKKEAHTTIEVFEN